MIFLLRLIIFSFLILLGFRLSLRSKKGCAFVSVVYAVVLLHYTFLCRVKITINVTASDYGYAITTQRSVGESIWRIVKAIFGMDSSGHLAGVYWQAFILNSYLFIPLGYLVLLWLLCGDSTVPASSVGRGSRDVITDGDSSHVNEVATTSQSEKRALAKIALRTEMICIATSLAIELLQKITDLGMFDINDILANSIGGAVGIFLTLVWMRKHTSFPMKQG